MINEKNIDGVDLRAQEAEFVAEFSCGGAPVVLKGGIVVKAQADSAGGTTGEYTNKMANKIEVEFIVVAEGIQLEPRNRITAVARPLEDGLSALQGVQIARVTTRAGRDT